MVQSPWEANWFVASQECPRISRNPKPEGSLPHSQASVTCPYPEPAQSSPYMLRDVSPKNTPPPATRVGE